TNCRAAGVLSRLLPHARILLMVRDGRDVACSLVKMPWGPRDHLSALDFWADNLREAHTGMSSATAEHCLTLRLEGLTVNDREGSIAAIARWLHVDDPGPMRRFLDRHMNADRGHVGRWRSEVPADLREAFEARFDALAATLRSEGIPDIAL